MRGQRNTQIVLDYEGSGIVVENVTADVIKSSLNRTKYDVIFFPGGKHEVGKKISTTRTFLTELLGCSRPDLSSQRYLAGYFQQGFQPAGYIRRDIRLDMSGRIYTVGLSHRGYIQPDLVGRK